MDGGYQLVTKDDFSQFKWFWESDVANAQVVARCLLQWFAVFGVCYHWHVLGAHHHFTTARCPWANGTVESAMKITLKTFRSLFSEWLMQPSQWRLIVPVVMLVLNQTPSESIGGVAPITAMTGSHAMSPLDLIPLSVKAKVVTLEKLCAGAADPSIRKDETQERRKMGPRWPSLMLEILFSIWMNGAFVKTASSWIFEIQNLVSGVVRDAHASRLKFYADESLDVDEELLRHVAHNADDYVVDQFLECRFNPKTTSYEVLVSWRGLQDIENSWEPARNLLEDIPVAFKRYVQDNMNDEDITAMAAALDLMQSLGGIVAKFGFAESMSTSQDGSQGFKLP
ncbi:Aste57867_4246 [Aphanomyces stellatus]|uniref:Aste57867_4246 protein n=1 Tax=Aphanomyces stellatus TaxID=120398 RepID=A0A485KB53_9STRA|nr:hypothetical protein As57867_004235 [Aphanomyces stellatus]VFT81362.1 Aste57867_4246 [Aphanomyces stellatus]